MKAFRIGIAAFVAGTGLVGALSGSAAASALPAGSAVRLTVKAEPAPSDVLVLGAALSPAASGRQVTFYVQTQQFSTRGWMALGTAATNSRGVATYSYVPTWTGMENFGAAVGTQGSGATPAAVTPFNVLRDPPGVKQSVMEYPRPLGSVGGVLVKSLLVVLALVWLTLLGSLVTVIRRVPKLAGDTQSGRTREVAE